MIPRTLPAPPSGNNIAGYYQGMTQDQGIMNSVDSDEGAGITADPAVTPGPATATDRKQRANGC